MLPLIGILFFILVGVTCLSAGVMIRNVCRDSLVMEHYPRAAPWLGWAAILIIYAGIFLVGFGVAGGIKTLVATFS